MFSLQLHPISEGYLAKFLRFGMPVCLLVGALISVLGGWLPWQNTLMLLGFSSALAVYQSFALPVVGRCLVWSLVVVLGLAIGLYRPDGFQFPVVFTHFRTWSGALVDFLLSVNTGKAFAGYVALWFLCVYKVRPACSGVLSMRTGLVLVAGFCAIILTVAISTLGLSLEPKGLADIARFALVNLLVTCVSEEVFMRLIFQVAILSTVLLLIRHRVLANLVALVCVSVLFLVTHSVGEAAHVFLLAGFLYALIFTLTNRLSLAILLHFSVNVLHFSLFTYPLPT